MTLNQSLKPYANLCHQIAYDHGFWPIKPNISDIQRALLMIHTEISEATEALRETGKVNNKFTVEIADVLIRCFDLIGALNLDIDPVFQEKVERNTMRPMRHGKAF